MVISKVVLKLHPKQVLHMPRGSYNPYHHPKVLTEYHTNIKMIVIGQNDFTEMSQKDGLINS